MAEASQASTRCGIDSVELARVERLLRDTPADDLTRLFSPEELRDAGIGPGRVASLAARFAAKEACLKLFPRETALNQIAAADFAVRRNGYGEPSIVASPQAQEVLDRYRLGAISVSLTHDAARAAAVAIGEPARTRAPLIGKLIYYLCPIRRRTVLGNLRRVFGGRIPDAEIRTLAQAFYGHFARLIAEFLRFPFMSARRRAAIVRVENEEVFHALDKAGRGALILTGHFGNWETAVAAASLKLPQYHGRIHFLRKPLWPPILDTIVTRRIRRAGVGVIARRGSLDDVLDRIEHNEAVVFVLDQHAGGRDGISADFFGAPAATFKSLAIVALSTRAPVVPAACWREADGTHVMRFEQPLETIDRDKPDEAIRANTRAYNAALERLVLRHPEQWFWVHRRWKDERGVEI